MNRASLFIILIIFVFIPESYAHPAGNMVHSGKHVLWTYVSPVGDIDHHASIMIWDQINEPVLFLTSEYPSSDYFLYANGDDIFIIERRNTVNNSTFIRLFKTTVDHQTVDLMPWSLDNNRMGEGGFIVNEDGSVLFTSYPHIFKLNVDNTISKWRDFDSPVRRIRSVDEGRILALTENGCLLLTPEGEIMNSWENLIDPSVENAPLNRNVIFDADYKNEKLLLAYWGDKKFVLIQDKVRTVLVAPEETFIPHWVLIIDNGYLLFSSRLDFNNPFTDDGLFTTVTPSLILHSDENILPVWKF